MDEQNTCPQPVQQNWSAEYLRPKPPFTSSPREHAAAFVAYLAAYIYIYALFSADSLFTGWGEMWKIWLTVFTVLFVLMAEYLHAGVPRLKESWIWLGCAAAIVLSLFVRLHPAQEPVWNEVQAAFFLHIFAVWWALARTGRLAGGESGHLLPLDALNGFVTVPFGNFFLRIRCAVDALKPKRKKIRIWTVAAVAAAALAGLALLILAAEELARADRSFDAILDSLRFSLEPDLNTEILIRVILSLPVGAYVFGLLAGLGRQDLQRLHTRGRAAEASLGKMHHVPDAAWIAVLAVFSAMYLLFFFLQGRYLFGALTRTLPEGFTVAEYARQGFFELLRVMAINFVLFWLVTRTDRSAPGTARVLRIMSVVLLAQSMIFALIALSKLALYISCFGFTPKRLQSSWLACVLLVGCGCAVYTRLTGKKSFRAWMIFGAVTMALLHLY